MTPFSNFQQGRNPVPGFPLLWTHVARTSHFFRYTLPRSRGGLFIVLSLDVLNDRLSHWRGEVR